MYLAQISTPYIGLGKETSWATAVYAINVDAEDQARGVVRQLCGEKDPVVAHALLEQDNRKENEYFDIVLHRVPSNCLAVYVPRPHTGFPKPNRSFRM